MSVCFDTFHPSRIGTISYPSVLYQFRCLALGHNTVTLTSMSLELASLQLSHCAPHRHERLRQTLSIITLILLDSHARIQEISSGGVQVSLTKKGSEVFFLVPSLFYRTQMVNFKEIYHFSRFQKGYNIFLGGGGGGGGGVKLVPGRRGGGGSNCLFPIETNITSDFPGGGGVWTPCPPPSGSALDCLLLINKTRHADNNYLDPLSPPPSGSALDCLLLINKTRHADNNYLHVWILKRNVSFRRFF